MSDTNDEISMMPELSEAQFHTVWTEAVGLEGYNKRLFQEVYNNLLKKGKITNPSPARAVCQDCQSVYKSNNRCPECFPL
jgi:methionyl-tRNA synthetase